MNNGFALFIKLEGQKLKQKEHLVSNENKNVSVAINIIIFFFVLKWGQRRIQFYQSMSNLQYSFNLYILSVLVSVRRICWVLHILSYNLVYSSMCLIILLLLQLEYLGDAGIPSFKQIEFLTKLAFFPLPLFQMYEKFHQKIPESFFETWQCSKCWTKKNNLLFK